MHACWCGRSLHLIQGPLTAPLHAGGSLSGPQKWGGQTTGLAGEGCRRRMPKEKALTGYRWGGSKLGRGTTNGQYGFHGPHILQEGSRICEARQFFSQEGTNRTRQLLRQKGWRGERMPRDIRSETALTFCARRPGPGQPEAARPADWRRRAPGTVVDCSRGRRRPSRTPTSRSGIAARRRRKTCPISLAPLACRA